LVSCLLFYLFTCIALEMQVVKARTEKHPTAIQKILKFIGLNCI
jgi:hypothetical protein